MKRFARLCLFIVSCLPLHSAISAEDNATLFEFTEASAVSKWQIVNDGVMGGRSTSQARIVPLESGGAMMQFSGNLSLENNGGFASVRSRPSGSLGLEAGDTIVLRVKGDGRRYTFNLYTPDRRTAFSYQTDFDTKQGEWIEIKLPVDKFVAHSFGRPMANMQLAPARVQAVGILLGDKKPGAFEIAIDWIKIAK
ncbi:CIA30 family protein [Planctomycetaceae bacterium SH139]